MRAGTQEVRGWTVRWAYTNGQTITQVWNGSLLSNAPNVAVRNLGYNAVIPANGNTTFGFLGNWNGANGIPAPITCATP